MTFGGWCAIGAAAMIGAALGVAFASTPEHRDPPIGENLYVLWPGHGVQFYDQDAS